MPYKFLAESKDTAATPPSKEYLIIVEGEDDGVFLEHVLNLKDADENKVQVQYVKGISKIPPYLSALSKSPPLTSGVIKNIAIILDADSDFNQAGSRLRMWLEEANLPIAEPGTVNKDGPVSVGIYLLPNSKDSGELEDLIISCLAEDERIIAARNLLDQFDPQRILRKFSKRIIQISLAISNVDLCSGAGRGIRNGAFPIQLKDLQDLNEFLSNFLS